MTVSKFRDFYNTVITVNASYEDVRLGAEGAFVRATGQHENGCLNGSFDRVYTGKC